MSAEKLISVAYEFIDSLEATLDAEEKLRNASPEEDNKALRNYILKKALAEDRRQAVQSLIADLKEAS